MSHVTLKIKISISPPEQTQHLYLRAQGSSYLGPLISAGFDSSSISRESAWALITRICPALYSEMGQLCTHAAPQISQLNPDPHCLQRGRGELRSLLAGGQGSIRGGNPPGCPPRISTACPRARAEPGGLPGAGGRRPLTFPDPRGVLRSLRDPRGPGLGARASPRPRRRPRGDPRGGAHPAAARSSRQAPHPARASASPGPRRAGAPGAEPPGRLRRRCGNGGRARGLPDRAPERSRRGGGGG